ncbi:RsmD family RNA methyltransferase [Methanomassiliicoccus luminyensis]|uniref:RsmD family RNA methyltransferase n=1 Tax=Methanomassiliicoccus luminyensis TaxID=1080712 RepID=UPI0011CC162B|nr:RsmD family RNA methyltransferase [Methanomassiliicoccus luminyensis]
MSHKPYFFELSGEHASLPEAEAMACCRAECGACDLVADGPGFIVASFDGERLGTIGSRIALTHRIGAYLGSCSPQDVDPFASRLELPDGSVAVRAKRYREYLPEVDVGKLGSRVGALVAKGRKVDLADPDVELRVLLSDRLHFFISEKVVDRRSFELRKVAERPFFSPISLHPKYARALINLTEVKRGERLLDPFCGTGGLLIEAASMGVRAVGSDISEEMVQGAKENMGHFGLPWETVERADIGDVRSMFGEVDAVATDPPYGRSTSTRKEPLGDLYPRALRSISGAVKSGGKAGVVLPRPCPVPPEELELEGTHLQRVHRSLTRHYCLFRKK